MKPNGPRLRSAPRYPTHYPNPGRSLESDMATSPTDMSRDQIVQELNRLVKNKQQVDDLRWPDPVTYDDDVPNIQIAYPGFVSWLHRATAAASPRPATNAGSSSCST